MKYMILVYAAARIAEGTALVTEALRRGPPGPYQVQAAIAALHDEAPTAGETDWPQILALYEVLMQASDNPVVALNHAVAAAMVHGPRVGLQLLENVGADERIAAGYRLHAVRANLLEMAGDRGAARDAYLRAAELTASLPHQRYLNARAARLAGQAG
jgi:predicted RNA polymerase sigma factor